MAGTQTQCPLTRDVRFREVSVSRGSTVLLHTVHTFCFVSVLSIFVQVHIFHYRKAYYMYAQRTYFLKMMLTLRKLISYKICQVVEYDFKMNIIKWKSSRTPVNQLNCSICH